nr:hypothetical protein [Planctomycetota bacterium]
PRTPTQRANAWPAPEDEHDRRVKPAPIVQGFHPVSQGMRLGADPDRSHHLVIEPPADPGFAESGPRTIAVPYMPPRTSSLPEEVPRWYQLDSRPIRLHDGPTAARR